MEISRTELLKALTIAKPALAIKDIIFETTHFWFTGETVFAYDDRIGIEVPFKSDFQGGILGKLLLGILEKSRADKIVIEPGRHEGEILLKIGRARIDLAHLELKRAIWHFPKLTKADEEEFFDIDVNFASIIDQMLICAGQNTSVPDQLGVTFKPSEENNLDLYTTDGSTIAWAQLELPEGYQAHRCCVPVEFCAQLVALCKAKGEMLISDDFSVAEFESGVRIFGRMVDVPRPLDFQEQIEECVPEPELLVKLPGRFKLAIERVAVILEHLPGAPAEVSIDKEGVLRLFAKADRGEIRDAMRLDQEHEEVVSYFDPALVRRGVDKRTEFFLRRDVLVMRGPENYYQLISSKDG